MKFCRNILFRFFLVVAIISSLIVPPGFCLETEDSQIFMSGFNAYQQKNYATAIKRMNEVLQKYPDSPLRDMTIFWLARSYYKNGDQRDAARYMSQFAKEYPDNPLRATVEDELLALVDRYDKGETLPIGEAAAKQAQAPTVQPEAEQPAVQSAEQQAEQKRQAALKAEQEQQAKEQAAKAELAKQQADQERQGAEKVEQEQQAKEQAAREQLAKQQAEKERLAKQQADQERQATEKIEQEQQAKEQAAGEQLAKQQAEKERLAKLKSEQERIASEKAEQERMASEQEAKEQLARQQAEKERLAKLTSEQERIASEKAEQERLASEQEAKEQLTRQQAEKERLAKRKSDQERMAAEKAAETAELEKLAAEKAALQRQAAVAAEREHLAKKKAEEERAAAEAASAAEASAAQQQAAAAKAEELLQAQSRQAEEKARTGKAMLREKAIAQYKSIIENYPASGAAITAAAKLKELGVAVALPPQAAQDEHQENAQVLRFEVGQYVGFEFNLLARPTAYEVARRTSIPFEVINRGNGSDSFAFESAFPAGFRAEFAAADTPEKTIKETPKLAPGEVFRGVVSFEIPPASIDGLKITYPVKASSTLMAEASQSREVAMTASAPLLRAVLKADKTHLLPGGQVAYRIIVLNIGTMAAKDVTLNLNYPPQLEPLDYSATGFKQGMKSVMVSDGLQIRSGESREFSVAFRLKDDSLAGQELTTRAELVDNPLKTSATFVSNVAYIDPQHGVAIHTASERLVVIPGQTTSIPFVVTNTGNLSEKYRIAATLKSPQETVVIYHDINRDGIHQANEPAITEIGPLGPKEEASIIVEFKTPRSVSDGTEDNVLLSLTPEGDTARSASASAHLFYSRPVLKMAVTARDGRLKPGEVASFDMVITNGGSNLARTVELQSTWPEQLELVGADPSNSSISNGNILWKFKELGAGEKRAIKVSFRVKHGIGVGTNIQVKNVLTYEDQLGNRY
ncbi:MAG: tetratricopeptide repeat protein [Oryzomonas sp.]|uniref:tetratricopeptide repeat protein n=1 Tax=Oryzomonas sp. TaxID=2855186 RepID=UPI00284A04BB|nr:tetratricopeptide repeat protein [Oryzomonas sp.]MDR3580566.1 tetratricopeptide repeat protein [Oryzomonas sp.]